MAKRFMVLACALVLGAAAPARAWCEATCLAPVHASDAAKPHCPTHDPASTGTSMSATQIDDCPVVESARTLTQARLEQKATTLTAWMPPLTLASAHAADATSPHRPTTVFERSTPLRI